LKNDLKEKISNNLDVSYYLNWMGEHALKAGIGYTYLHENYDQTTLHPRVYMGFGRSTTALGDPIGVDGEPGTPNYGQYGYYYIRGSFTQPINGGFWNIHANNFSLFAQDSWTIKERLTINFGLRAEGQVIPSMTNDRSYTGFTDKPVKFDLGDALAPRLGVIYDVFGNSRTKVFASFGIYYDVMKLYMAELTFGGWKRVQDYYSLNTLDWTAIAASGAFDDPASQAAGGTYVGSLDFLPPSFGRVDPNLKPTAQREISLGAEQRLSEDLSLSVRLVNKHLLRTIEDVGVWSKETDPVTGTLKWVETFYICNPGFGWSLPASQGGKFDDNQWPCPKATRDYYGLNISLEKRFSNNWQGGVNYTLSRVEGNYSGLASSDEVGYDYAGVARVGPNVELYYDDWFLAYDAKGKVLEGPLPQDRTHFLKAYGSYTFPFGLTVGAIAYGRSGFPVTTRVFLNDRWMLVNNRGDLGRLPFTFWTDLFLEYTLKLGGNYRASINLQVNNILNTKTIQSINRDYNLDGISASDEEILDGTLAAQWQQMVADANDVSTGYNKWETRFAPWSARLGFKFSF